MTDKNDNMKTNKPAPPADDDIRGLFSRFGGASEAAGYRDFSSAPLPGPRMRAPSPGPAAPGAEPARNAPSRDVRATPAVSPLAAPACPDTGLQDVAATPLAALFRRLMEARPAVDATAANPLRRIVNGP